MAYSKAKEVTHHKCPLFTYCLSITDSALKENHGAVVG